MIKNITNETINAIKDGAVVELGANAKVEHKGKSVVLTIDGKKKVFPDMDYTLSESLLAKHINLSINHSNHKKLHNIINRLFTEMDYNLSLEFGDFTLGLAEKENDVMWLDEVIYVIPTDAKDEDGDWDWSEALFFSLEPYFKTYADLLRGDRDIIGDMANAILRNIETFTTHLSTGGTTETHKAVVVE